MTLLPSKTCGRFSIGSSLALALTLAYAGVAHADGFQTGQFVTYDQGAWSSVSGATNLLTDDYSTVYPSNILTVGLPNIGFEMQFDQPLPLLLYLPAGGVPGQLTSNVLDPTTTPAGSFGGNVLALQLNVDFSNAGLLSHPAGIPFGDLVLTNFGGILAGLNGLTVTEFLADANTCLGGGFCIRDIGIMDTIAADLNVSFDGGTVSAFADSNLALPMSATVPEPSSLLLLGAGLFGLGFLLRRSKETAP